jgi:hypothetical protein
MRAGRVWSIPKRTRHGRFKQDCLAEYARHTYEGEPLFQTVGLDQTFYGPATVDQLAHYAKQLPNEFDVCSKVWEVLPPYAETFTRHTGPFLFEFQRTGIWPDEFLPKLDHFLSRLQTQYRYAVRLGYRFWHEKAEMAFSVFNALNDRHKEYPLGDTIGSRVMGWLTLKF